MNHEEDILGAWDDVEPRPSFKARLASDRPLLAVELRPPRRELDGTHALDAWIDVYQTVRRLSAWDTVIFLTDSAVGVPEEENLMHLVRNLGEDADRERVVPFLTLKHPLSYCLGFAVRARDADFPALVVLGGDPEDGAPRCLPHAYALRERLRRQCPGLFLGGWINPRRDPEEQVGFLAPHADGLDFVLTQVVSAGDAPRVSESVDALDRAGVGVPVIVGVFHYRSARRRTLDKLARFIPVPYAQLERDFVERGLSADEVTAEAIRALLASGLKRFYISNLPTGTASAHLQRIARLAGVPVS